MGLVESAQMAQDWYLHKEEMEFNAKAMTLDKKALAIDLVNTIREDLRDLFQSRATRIDNLMLVNTLLLSFSFGFVCEGTFPPGDSADEWLVCYSVLCALVLVTPFWSIWYSLECKTNLDRFLNQILTERTDDRLKLDTWLRFYQAFEQYWKLNCENYYFWAQNLFWIGMLLSLCLCCNLLALVFDDLFPADYIGTIFVAIVMANILVAVFLMLKKGFYYIFHLGAATEMRKMVLPMDGPPVLDSPPRGNEPSSPLLNLASEPLLVNSAQVQQRNMKGGRAQKKLHAKVPRSHTEPLIDHPWSADILSEG